MFKVDIQSEQKQAVAIEARRTREKQRQSRIFNVQNQVIGVDMEALKNQVMERRKREDAERAREEAFDANCVRCDLMAQMLEKEEAQRARQLAQQVQAFREKEQQPQRCREFDPGRLQKKPVRAGDQDPCCGPSSMQYFAGEDLNCTTRRRLQQEQSRRDLGRQWEEHLQAKRQEKYLDILEGQRQIEMDLRAVHLDELEATHRRVKDVAMANYNRSQATEMDIQQQLARQREQDDNLTEIYNHLTSDMLTEKRPASSKSQKVIPKHWKGMSPEQIAAIQKEQAVQRLEAQHRRKAEKRQEAEWARQEQMAAQTACQLEHEQQVQAQKLRRDLDAYNKELAQEQQAKKDYLDKVVYTNEPTSQFYLQFNTSSR
ncbi:RIB43A-like with coiled-coils protein 1 isoform X1 [Antechinus flavipes]|uniref:RIB43A-like with coiled-coils protein 1 isoform X1 n=2 Tax=Antechinus flavipes TaxID=38775 RepID=UPI002235A85D|nr:RIB43A-like with coiled-coils protein 1 isoform X1 [Antechinus flavipes]XP_051824413.1 RIB43A-like with coiled-coils protein 1 isoform X1 [Antechinus flavipes]XP_051824414.1 RIB43A-like with coiled-coils protein 1 isoform X1 [Antechinus flavipes]XP_051824415.1 RIB43A-like with coiled-coils protein 1 isoform X1 [Antechinus flavipes]XP_051824416.1 RIB43A-like with coiled-coils protein 1 isoform X1 [Antechinus flavipes]